MEKFNKHKVLMVLFTLSGQSVFLYQISVQNGDNSKPLPHSYFIRLYYFIPSNCFMTTSAISFELNRFCPVIKLSSTR